MGKENISVEVELTLEDVYSFEKSVIYRVIPPAAFIIISVILVGLSVLTFFDDIDMSAKVTRISLLLIAPVIFLLIPVILKRSAASVLNSSKLLSKPQSYNIDEEGITVAWENGNSHLKWDELYKAIETKDSFQLFISRRQAYIIPKRFFDTVSEDADILRTLMKKVPVPKECKKNGIKKLWRNLLIYIILFFIILVVLVIMQT